MRVSRGSVGLSERERALRGISSSEEKRKKKGRESARMGLSKNQRRMIKTD